MLVCAGAPAWGFQEEDQRHGVTPISEYYTRICGVCLEAGIAAARDDIMAHPPVCRSPGNSVCC